LPFLGYVSRQREGRLQIQQHKKVIYRYSRRKSLESALEKVASLNREGISCSLTYLPVINHSPPSIERELLDFERMFEAIAQCRLDSDVTIKLHQLGIYRSSDLARQAVLRLAAAAAERQNFLWIDMERRRTVDATLDIFRQASATFNNVGICLQAYLKRTEADLHALLERRVPVRLVKGFYKEYDFKKWHEVTENYAKLMPYLLLHSDRPAIATHDLTLIEKAKNFIVANHVTGAEFQFFKGVRESLQRDLARDGFKVRVYLPCGNLWRFLVDGLASFDKWHQAQRMLGLRPRG
jgi:proline dehydrogenase